MRKSCLHTNYERLESAEAPEPWAGAKSDNTESTEKKAVAKSVDTNTYGPTFYGMNQTISEKEALHLPKA